MREKEREKRERERRREDEKRERRIHLCVSDDVDCAGNAKEEEEEVR